MPEILIAPSMLSADFARLSESLSEVEKAGGDWLHVDIMDGHFVPNLTFGPDQMGMLRDDLTIPFDVHLMMTNPKPFIDRFVKKGADLISVHVECDDDLDECFEAMEKGGVKKGIVIKPETPVEDLEPWLDKVDLVLVMGVHPGFGGQSYIPETTERIKKIKELIGDRDILIEVDGGVNKNTIEEVVGAGTDVLVMGSAVFNGDVEKNMKELRGLIK